MLTNRLKTFLEIAAVFAVFFIFGAWKVPDVNEAHYICKAIHYWQPNWVQNDPFLQSGDAHWTFYLVIGWLSFFCSPLAMAWIGRIVAWSLLAWSWQRLSFALIPVRWVAIPTALALGYYIESFHMAGEWLIGGIEGKSLAYPFVFFALEAMLRRRWNRTGIFLGIACAFHILVGGWVTLVVGVIFLMDRGKHSPPAEGWHFAQQNDGVVPDARETTPPLRGTPPKEGNYSAEYRTLPSGCRLPWIGLILGGLLALCGLLPALMLDAGTSTETVHKAHQIYVFNRLPHHLVPYTFKDSFLLRFALLTIFWILLCRRTGGRKQRMFNAFVWGTLVIAAVGMILAHCFSGNKELSAEILRFYWFRLSDIAVPMGIALGGMRCCLSWLKDVQSTGNDLRALCANFAPFAVKEFTAESAKNSQRTQKNHLPLSTLQNIICISVCITAIYFATTYICFGWLKFTPDANVAWAITLLVCLAYFALTLRPLRFNFTAKNAENSQRAQRHVALALIYFAIVFYAPLTILPNYADLRTHSGQCRTDTVGPNGKRSAEEWQDMCQWIKEHTEPTDKFWIPRDGHTFKWHARRSDIGTWKNIPQDSKSIVNWFTAMRELYVYKNAEGKNAEDRLITTLVNSKTEEQIAELQQKYDFDYILCAQAYEMPTHSTLELVYENEVYVLYYVTRQ